MEEIDWSRDPVRIVNGKKYLYIGNLDIGTRVIKEFSIDENGDILCGEPLTKYSLMDSRTLSASEATYGIENGVVKLNVVNKKGFDLPTTGGMGTWMFTIGGLVLMAGAVVVFISSKKKHK